MWRSFRRACGAARGSSRSGGSSSGAESVVWSRRRSDRARQTLEARPLVRGSACASPRAPPGRILMPLARGVYEPPTMVAIHEIRAVALALPRTTEGFVRGQVKFYIGRIVYLAISRDEATLGFAVPKEWRAALVESEPEKFS